MEFNPVDVAAIFLGVFIVAWLTYKTLKLLWAALILAAKLGIACVAGAIAYKCLEYQLDFEDGADSYWKSSLLFGAVRELGNSLEPLGRFEFSGANATFWEVYRSVQGTRTHALALWNLLGG